MNSYTTCYTLNNTKAINLFGMITQNDLFWEERYLCPNIKRQRLHKENEN
jgi:hypothetical protein